MGSSLRSGLVSKLEVIGSDNYTENATKMKPISLLILAVLMVSGLGCKLGSMFGAGEFSSDVHHFSIKFPGGSGGVETEAGKAKNKYITTPGPTYSKNFDNRSDNYRSYEVNVFNLNLDTPKDPQAEKTILSIGLNGWDSEPDTTTKEVTINGMNALDSVRTVAIGPVKMTFREVVFWSDKTKLLYVIRVAAAKEENVKTQDAEEFIKSFKMV